MVQRQRLETWFGWGTWGVTSDHFSATPFRSGERAGHAPSEELACRWPVLEETGWFLFNCTEFCKKKISPQNAWFKHGKGSGCSLLNQTKR